jgi:alpha-amylase/alpha-mannosidase (GH57 family)
MAKVRLAFLWHMHQPLYREPESGDQLLPWVRLHATRAYLEMAHALERHPAIRCTVNFTPVLLEQLDAYVGGTVRDRYAELTARAPADLSLDERAAILRGFFMVDWDHNVRPLPRYWELLQKRGRAPSPSELRRLAAAFTDPELTDLQVLFNLAWAGPAALEEEEVLRSLRARGRDFGRADVDALLAAQRRLMASIVPRWRRLAERGQVELSTTPYHHPILPLVCDTDAARRALPGVALPPRFAHPEDARWHVRAAIDAQARWFGAPPVGMWPAEGAVSPEALAILASEGVRWAASDEGVLLHSLPVEATRARSLYRPWRVAAGDRELQMLFRDRALSDLIGFTYAHAPAREAAADFVGRVLAAGDGAGREGRADPPTVGVFLDGENPWEHYPASGREFLDALYHAIEASGRIETVTLSEAVASAEAFVPRIHSGSWIEASYRIWIGHGEDRAAWTALGRVRDAVAAAEREGHVAADALARAQAHLHAAEGSDWYWWYGEDFTTELAAEFDALFRGHVIQAALLVGAAPPVEALAPIKRPAEAAAVGAEARPLREPSALLRPTLDGRETSFFEWQGAGLHRAGARRGSMHGGSQAFELLYYGFDLEHLYLRLDPAESSARAAEVGSAVRITILADGRWTTLDFPLVPDGASRPGHDHGEPVGVASFAQVLEIGIPFGALGLAPHARVAIAVHVLRGEIEVERVPSYGYVTFEVPGPDFEGIHWRV